MIAAQLLQSAGLRRTKIRKLVLETLIQADRPLSHQEIASRPEMRALDRVTLYRTLMTLGKAGLLHRIQGVDGVWRFCSHTEHTSRCGGNHIHFLCVECKRMSCLPEQQLPWIQEPEGAEIFGKQLVVYGRCAVCNTGNAIGGSGEDRRSVDNGSGPRAGTRKPPRKKKNEKKS